ncbi:hypothetical protein [Variovorax sp.]|uniref:hypothetical protein n=1 Tax=Variovorax sp. TaxID=1871043 RepID=UPI003BAA0D25
MHMDTRDFDELAGRIEGVAEAVVLLSAHLDTCGLLDGSRLSREWREARRPDVLPQLETARVTLGELAKALDRLRVPPARLASR